MDIKEIQKICKEFEHDNGKGSIFTAGSSNSNLLIPRWSTGIEDLDEVIGGGMPQGRIVEIFGPESSGKTSLAYHLISRCKLGVYIPIEGTYDECSAIRIGVKPKQMIVGRANYGEQALNVVRRFAKAAIPVVVLDSVPACTPKEDIEKLEKDAENDTRIGGISRLFSKMLPIIVRECEKTGTTVILINQIRDKMNAMMFGEKFDTPGGRAIKFYTSIRIQVGRKGWIEIPNKNPKISSLNKKVGMLMKVRVYKSKVCNPYGECEIPLFFDRGFESFDDIKDIRKELMIKQRKELEND